MTLAILECVLKITIASFVLVLVLVLVLEKGLKIEDEDEDEDDYDSGKGIFKTRSYLTPTHLGPLACVARGGGFEGVSVSGSDQSPRSQSATRPMACASRI